MPDHFINVESWQKAHRDAAQHGAVHGDKQSVHVIDRQGMQQHIIFDEAPKVDQRKCIAGQVIVAQHRAFGAPGGSGGVNDRRNIVTANLGNGCVRVCRRNGIHQSPLAIASKRQQGCPGVRRGLLQC